jgi:hypothetical protein
MLGVSVSWRLAVVPAALVAGGILAFCWPYPHPGPVTPPRVSASPPRQASPPLDLAAELRELGKRWGAPHAEPPEDGPYVYVYAIGACERPSDGEVELLARRIQRWVDRQYPGEQSAKGGADLTIGCKSPRGIVVDVSDERGRPVAKPLLPHETHRTLVLRVQPDHIDRLAEWAGTGSDYATEGSQTGYVTALALVDLDGDGVQDVVIDHVDHEGGAFHAGHTLEIVRSKTGGRATIAKLFGDIVVANRDAAPLVLGLGDSLEHLQHVCLGEDGKLARCPASEATQHAYQQDEVAGRYASLKDNEVPDADLLAEELALLDVPKPQRTRLVAAARPTSDGQRAEREIARLVAAAEPRDPLDQLLDAHDPHATAQMYFEAQRVQLGDTPCTAPPVRAGLRERAAAWVRAHNVGLDRETGQCPPNGPCDRELPTALVVTPACGPYFWVSWHDSSKAGPISDEQHHVVLFGDDMQRVVAYAGNGPTDSAGSYDPNGYEPPTLDAVFFRHGDTIVAGIVVGDTAVVVADNRIVASRPALQRYSFSRDWSDASPDLLYDPSTYTVWHPTRSGIDVVTTTEVTAHEARRRAIETLSKFTAQDATAADYRADTMRALTVLHADPALVARVARLQ